MRRSVSGSGRRAHALAGIRERDDDTAGERSVRATHAGDQDDELSVLPRLVVEAWARSQLRPMPGPDRWCPTCWEGKARAEVQVVIDGREALHRCRRCGTVLDREALPF